MFKYCLIDIDNTLYDYDRCHNSAITSVCNYLILLTPKYINTQLINTRLEDYIENIIEQSKNIVKQRALNVLAHSRILYFEEICHQLRLPVKCILDLDNLYWNTFYANMAETGSFKGIHKFFDWLITNNIKICAVTDFELNYQLQKLRILGLEHYFTRIVSSTQIGVEKPDARIFNYALKHLNATSAETFMIGDSYEKDVVGAYNCGIKPFYFLPTPSVDTPIFEQTVFTEYCITFNSYDWLTSFFDTLFCSIHEYVYLNKRCGEREDLVQAGGGNISVKIKEYGLIIVKQSGIALADTTFTSGYNIINHNITNQDITNQDITNQDFTNQDITNQDITNNNLTNHNKVIFGNSSKLNSIETPMHTSINSKYVVHLHPTAVNIIGCSSNQAKTVLKSKFADCFVIDYVKPGIELVKILQELKVNDNHSEKTIFLLNHGIIFGSDDITNLKTIIDKTINKCCNITGFTTDYKMCNIISDRLYDGGVTILSELTTKEKNNITKASTPDVAVYCSDAIFIENERIYIHSQSLKKCKNIESVLRQHLTIINATTPNCLETDQINELINWDAEKYRAGA